MEGKKKIEPLSFFPLKNESDRHGRALQFETTSLSRANEDKERSGTTWSAQRGPLNVVRTTWFAVRANIARRMDGKMKAECRVRGDIGSSIFSLLGKLLENSVSQ